MRAGLVGVLAAEIRSRYPSLSLKQRPLELHHSQRHRRRFRYPRHDWRKLPVHRAESEEEITAKGILSAWPSAKIAGMLLELDMEHSGS